MHRWSSEDLPPRLPGQGCPQGLFGLIHGQRCTGRSRVCTHQCPGSPSPGGGQEPPTCPSTEEPWGRPWARTKPGLRGLQPLWDKPGTNPLTKRSSRRCPEVGFILSAPGWAKPPPQGDFRDTCSAFEVKRGLLEEGLESYCTGQGCAPARPEAQGHTAKLLCFAQVPRNFWGGL